MGAVGKTRDMWVFDLDGTLIDTHRASRRAVEAVLGRDLGKSVSGWTDRAVLDHWGVSLADYLYELDVLIAADKPSIVSRGWDLWERAHGLGARVCLLTGCHIAAALLKLDAALLGLGRAPPAAFTPVWDAEFGWWPTKLDAARSLRARLPSDHGRLWMVGDNDADHACAIELGATFLRVES